MLPKSSLAASHPLHGQLLCRWPKVLGRSALKHTVCRHTRPALDDMASRSSLHFPGVFWVPPDATYHSLLCSTRQPRELPVMLKSNACKMVSPRLQPSILAVNAKPSSPVTTSSPSSVCRTGGQYLGVSLCRSKRNQTLYEAVQAEAVQAGL